MNDKSFELGMIHTFFQNHTGLDIEDLWASNYSTPKELTILTRAALKHPLIWELSRESASVIYSLDRWPHFINNVNILAAIIPSFIGGKTGNTDSAGGSLILVFERPLGKPIALILLDSTRESRFSDAEILLRANNIL